MGKIAGKLLIIKSGASAYTALRSTALDFIRDMIDCTTGDSAGSWKEYLSGEKGGTIQVDGLFDSSGTQNAHQVYDDLDNGAVIDWTYGTATTGEDIWGGKALVSNLNINGDKNDVAAYSFTLQVTGEVTVTTN